jgi:Holliday junction resolvase-like predicted endonuclease
MAFSMKLWKVGGEKLAEVNKSVLNKEERLEDWIVADPAILGMDVLLIGRQVTTAYGGEIDLLAMDGEANLVILELKRDRTPRDVVAQTLDYASWVKSLSYQEIDAITHNFLQKNLKDAFESRFGFSIPEIVNSSHSMVILASELDDSSERIVQYLAEDYQVNINVIFTFFKQDGNEFLGRAWLMDPQEIQERSQPRKKAPWSGYYFVNVGEGEWRNWDDCRKYDFISAGQGPKYSGELKRLKEGDIIFAYMKDFGYVGYGTVTKPAMMVKDFVVARTGKKLLESSLVQPGLNENSDNPENSDWAVAIKWIKTFTRDEAKTFKGVFANQHIVCRLRDQQTVEFLNKEFGID